ncbi:MFS transporter [uncultured Phenylobacterium sp.]|uniref:MFS transporter n=1 Tax=uncultured Phenylobacterium sp. TaxID=349273 RepID=UPI0025F4C4B6|nr:MFS transporter [uncultured Phenylobacterium sp.]
MTGLLATELAGGRLPVGPRRAVAITTVLGAMALAVVDAGMVNVALPGLAQAFGVSPARAILVVTAYQAGMVMALLPLGALGERYGHRRVFAFSVTVFATASTAAAFAPGLPWLIAARVLQGLGGAGIMALGMALLRFTVSKGHLGRAIGWNALNVALTSAAAPALGALVLAATDWRGLFLSTLPVAVMVLAGTRALPATPRSDTPVDAASAGLNALAFALVILGAQAVTTAPWAGLACLASGGLAFLLLLRREAPRSNPMFPLDLLRGRSFRLSVLASTCCFAAQSAGLLAMPFLLQHQLHQAALTAGFYITVWPLSVAAAALVAGRLSDRLSTAWLCGLGGAALSAGLAGAGFWIDVTRPATLVPCLMLAGIGFGLFQSPNNRNMFLSAPAGRSGAAGGMQGAARVTGQTLGALAVALFFSLRSLDTAMKCSLGLAALLALCAGIVSLWRSTAVRHGGAENEGA